MNIKILLDAYKQLKEIEKKQKAVDKLSATELNYGIIKDLITSATYGVVIEVTFKDQTKMVIKREDQFDKRVAADAMGVF